MVEDRSCQLKRKYWKKTKIKMLNCVSVATTNTLDYHFLQLDQIKSMLASKDTPQCAGFTLTSFLPSFFFLAVLGVIGVVLGVTMIPRRPATVG